MIDISAWNEIGDLFEDTLLLGNGARALRPRFFGCSGLGMLV